MTREERRQMAIKIAWSFLGLPYIWGGDDPIKGFDCSGFCIEVLKSVGVLPRKGDWTAAGLWEKFGTYSIGSTELKEGCLVFYASRSHNRIVHVEMALNKFLTIGASGGTSQTLNEEASIQTNAYVKIRPWRSRLSVWGFADPFLSV